MGFIDYLIFYALSFSGIPYHYGGDDPISGFDCSGLIVEILKSAGVVAYNADLNAEDLYLLLSAKKIGTRLSSPKAGAIVFYGSHEHITHTGFCINDKLMLSAAGGDATTLSKDDAILAKAFVKLRPIYYRKDFVAAIMPNY